MHPSGEFNYEQRYGRSGQKRWLPYAIAFAIAGITWSLWAGLYHSNPAIRSQIISFNVTGEKEISIRYSIERTDPSQVIICTLTAMDFDKNVVGQIDDTIAAGSERSEQITIIPARITPVTASITRCRAE